MIGFYDYTVIATYFATVLSVVGIFEAIEGNISLAVFWLGISAILDTIDGKIARTKKNRSKQEKNFGIQIDSLNDVVCFGVLPSVIAYCIYVQKVAANVPMWFIVVLCFFVLCGLIRLAYFNVIEEERSSAQGIVRTYYTGLPITASSPLFIMMCIMISVLGHAQLIMTIFLLTVGFLFISPIKVSKPSNIVATVLIVIGLAMQFLLFYIW